MKRVLLAYDGSLGADAALQNLIKSTDDTEIHVLVLNVAEVWFPPDGSPNYEHEESLPASVRDARNRARQIVQCKCDRAEAAAQQLIEAHPQWQVKAAVATGPTANVIVNMAEEWNADLILLGSQPRSCFDRLIYSSVGNRVARLAKCPVEHVSVTSMLESPFQALIPGPRKVAVDHSKEKLSAVAGAN